MAKEPKNAYVGRSFILAPGLMLLFGLSKTLKASKDQRIDREHLKSEFVTTKNKKVEVILLSYTNALATENFFRKFWKMLREGSQDQERIIGLDAEWRPERGSEKHRVATLQLSTRNQAVVIQLLHMKEESFPPSLKELLKDESVIKVGMGVEDDCRRLARDYQLEVRSYLNLQTYSETVGFHFQGGLAGLSKMVLGVHLSKRLQCSNWAQRNLTKRQIDYAAKDAWVSLEVLHHMPRTSDDLYRDCMRLKKNIDMAKMKACIDKRAIIMDRTGQKNTVQSKETKKLRKSRLPTRKKKLYENCRMLAPDGEMLTTCGQKKIDWYVSKGLATYEDKEHTAIRLLFEPRGRSLKDDNYYISDKENRCCVCGHTEDYLRHHVVPHCYRQHFPEYMKNHLSHDVVLMCLPCHTVSSKKDQEKMQQLADMYQAPLPGVNGKKVIMDKDTMAVKKKINALLKHRETMPSEKVLTLEENLKDYFQVEELTLDFLQKKGNEIDPWIMNNDWVSHSEKVFKSIHKDDSSIESFIYSWREHFVTSMAPKYLPPFWKIQSRVHNSSSPNVHEFKTNA